MMVIDDVDTCIEFSRDAVIRSWPPKPAPAATAKTGPPATISVPAKTWWWRTATLLSVS